MLSEWRDPDSDMTPFVRAVIVSALTAVIAFWLGYSLGSSRDLSTPPALFERPPMSVCVKNSIATLMPLKVDTTLLRDTAELCYSQLYGEGLINDFQIRRLKFIQQAYDEQVLLWMVVAITISGVALAGVQLFVSFRLASSGKTDFDQGGEISLERNRLSLKSSVTGLFILALSFAFFIVFVYEVF